MLKATQCSVP